MLTAVRLLAAPSPPVVHLIERGGRFASGLAYSTANPQHLLNVRTSNMSAIAEWPTHFHDWLEARGTPVDPQTYVPRSTYGEYLQEVMQGAVEMLEAPDGLVLHADEVVSLTHDGARQRLGLRQGAPIIADATVLALGNLPPHPPCPVAPGLAQDGRYVADPWRWDAGKAPPEGLAVLFGTGLTMVDVALTLTARRPGLRLLALSRRGLLPRRHLEVPKGRRPDMDLSGPVHHLLRRLRARARDRDWRQVVDGLRPHVQDIWRTWPEAERRRFLRHARPWWDVHRHRLAPQVAERLDHLTASGTLRTVAGSGVALSASAHGMELAWRPRRERETVRTPVVLAVNCTGPAGDLTAADDTLLTDLQQRGLIRPDACRLGLDVDDSSRLVGVDGRPDPALFAVGPITRGAAWEITSVPDIRVQAAQCADRVLKTLKATVQ